MKYTLKKAIPTNAGLREQKKKLETVVENMSIKTQYGAINTIIENFDLGVVRCSYPDFNIIDMNSKFFNVLKAANTKFGLASSVIGENFFNIISRKVTKEMVLQSLINKKEASCVHNIDCLMGIEKKFIRLMFQLLRGLNSQIIEVIIIGIDITEEVVAKNKMEEVLKMQEELFANVSHELKTPLNVIFSTDQLLELYMKNNSLEANKKKIVSGIRLIKQNCYRSIKLINNIIDISKIESGFFKLSLSKENIIQIVEDIVQSVSDYIEDKKLNIVFDTDIEEKIIACDPVKIERIILNLISNAVKFTNPGGKIFVNIFDKVNFIEIDVRDTGVGIDRKHLDNIFERFHQVDKSLSRNAEGSGIGLTLVKLIIEMHGGNISVESEVGKGSTFKIILPAKGEQKLEVVNKTKPVDNKIEMINIEFSDIYSV